MELLIEMAREVADRLEYNKILYKRLVKKLGIEEKFWLMEFKGDYDKYERRLRTLAKKHAVEEA